MRKAILFSIFVLCAAPAVAGQEMCDAVPFTLGKSAASAPKVQKQQHAAKAAPVKKIAEAKPKPQPKPRLLAPCDDPKAKKKSG